MLEWLSSSDDPLLTRRFEWLGEWAAWEQVAVAVACLAVLALTAYNYRLLRPLRRRLGLLFLRAAAVGLLLYVFYQPAFIEERVQKSRNTVVVLVDDSQSLTLPYGDGTRLDAVRAFVERNAALWETLGQDNDVEVFRFADFVEPAKLSELASALGGGGKATDILHALEQVVERFRTRRLGGVILVSDGVDNGKLAFRLEDSVGLDAETRRFVESLGVPIYGVGFVGADSVKDVSVHSLRCTSFAFHLNATSLDTTVRIVGYPPGTQVPVSLYEDGKLVNSQTVVVEFDRRDYPLTFEYVPRELGDRVYTVAAVPLPGEVYEANNERSAIVKVIRDRIRVLQICGQTSWDERFLRNLLKRNPNVDLISFFILINPAYAAQLSSRDTTLIPFPAQELFVEELGGFDLIVFQNFNYGPFQTAQHLWRVRDFVKQGGGFLMVGGPRSFSEGRYHSTELTEILPVEIPPSFGGGETLDTQMFTPVIPREGRAHPITQLSLDPATNTALWAGLPELEGLNKTTRLKPGAVSLMNHPTLRNDEGKPMPVVATGEAGEGRVLAVMTDTTWLWSVLGSHESTGVNAYTEFWTNAIRWLIRDPELELVRITVDEVQHQLGAPVHIEVSVFGTDYQPAINHAVDVVVERRGSVREWASSTPIMDQRGVRTNPAGVVELDLEPTVAGVYEIRAEAAVGERTARARQVFLVVDSNPEFESTVAPLNYLDLLAEASKGSVFDVTSRPELDLKPPEVTQIIERSEKSLWSGADVLALAALLLGGEWWLRRKYGYL